MNPLTLTPEQEALLAPLTRLQKAVVTNLVSGMTQRQAYRAAGGTAKNDTSADTCVSVMLSHAKVRAALEGLQRAAVTSSIMSRTEALEKLTSVARTSAEALREYENAPVKTQLAALQQLAKMLGWEAPTKTAQTNVAGEDVDPAAAGLAVLEALSRKHAV